MKTPSLAPFYACLYPGLCGIAQKHGYALAIHGSMARDVDLIAVPWTEAAVPAEELVVAITKHCSAMLYPELLRLTCPWATEENIQQMVISAEGPAPEEKPHGRRSWSLHSHFGAYIDLSVMPRELNLPA